MYFVVIVLDVSQSEVKFKSTKLVRTQIKSSELYHLSFIDTSLTDVIISTKKLTAPIFKNCIFKNVILRSGDVNGVCFDEQSFTNVKFEGTICQTLRLGKLP